MSISDIENLILSIIDKYDFDEAIEEKLYLILKYYGND
jgi:hypothetical protein